MKTTKTHDAIDRALEESQKPDFRNHLGASLIGQECARYIWYVFHWAFVKSHKAAQIRLFDRGNIEEMRFLVWLRNAGIRVEPVNPQTRKQWRVSAFMDHFGGSLDSLLQNVPDLDLNEWCNAEYKTHNDKQFANLQKSGVAGSHWTHYVQMQIYMHLMGLKHSLYLAINKNNDQMYSEIVDYNPEIAKEYLHRAEKIIFAREAPPRIAQTPGWWRCHEKWCDARGVCWEGQPMQFNCRTCAFSEPREQGTWMCMRYQYVLSRDEQLRGCRDHQYRG
jgi:hypothetical protein